MRLLSIIVLAGIPLGLFSPDEPARAYKFYMTDDTGEPLRWWQRAMLEFTLSTVEPEEDGGSERLLDMAQIAFDAWVDTPCGLVPEVAFGGMRQEQRATTPVSLNASPDNLIVFIRSAAEWARLKNSPTWIAITKIAHDPTTGEIVDADVEINDGGYRFSYDDTPGPNEVDFLSMLTHEAGHFFGLDHSLDADATMYATYATDPDDALGARTLSQDDIDGVCALYTDVPVHKERGDGGETCAVGSGGLFGLWGLGLLLARRRSCRLRPTWPRRLRARS